MPTLNPLVAHCHVVMTTFGTASKHKIGTMTTTTCGVARVKTKPRPQQQQTLVAPVKLAS